MGKFGDSATELGRRFLVNADVMNVALRNAGVLEGEPGDWRLTDAGSDWANERYFTNGRHSDPRQNPSFPVRQFNPEMIDALGITAEDVAVAKLEVEAKRAARAAQLKVDRAAAEAEFLASQNPDASAADASGSRMDGKTVLVVAGVVVGVGATVYLVIKYVPPVRRRWDEKVSPWLARWAERLRGETDQDEAEQ